MARRRAAWVGSAQRSARGPDEETLAAAQFQGRIGYGLPQPWSKHCQSTNFSASARISADFKFELHRLTRASAEIGGDGGGGSAGVYSVCLHGLVFLLLCFEFA